MMPRSIQGGHAAELSSTIISNGPGHLSSNRRLGRKADALNRGKVKLVEPGHYFELEIVELNCTIIISANKIFVIDGKDVDLLVQSI